MQVITDQVTVFSKDNKPCATAKPGEVLLFKTLDCFSNRIPDEQTTMADLDYSYGFANPASGNKALNSEYKPIPARKAINLFSTSTTQVPNIPTLVGKVRHLYLYNSGGSKTTRKFEVQSSRKLRKYRELLIQSIATRTKDQISETTMHR